MLPEKTSNSQPVQPMVIELISRGQGFGLAHSDVTGMGGFGPHGMGGLGQMGQDPVSVALAAQKAGDFINKVMDFLHIGAGRREADQIVPYQNEVANQILVPISALINSGHDYSYSQWKSLYDSLAQAETAWLQFLHNTTWSDGRAAQQAEATLAPLFQREKDELSAKMSDAGGTSISDFFSGIFGGSSPLPAISQPTFPGGTRTSSLPAPNQAGFGSTGILLIGAAIVAMLLIKPAPTPQ